MKPYRRIVFLAAAVAVFVSLLGGNCRGEGQSTEDPLKAKAREKYVEGRRLFLTCDPNNFAKAMQNFEDALSYWQDYPEALAGWAETVSMWYGLMLPEEMFKTAYMRAQRAIRLAPDSDAGYRAMADLYRHRRDPATGKYDIEYANDIIERALKINPQSAENLYVKGSIMLLQNPEQAIGIFNQALAINPDLGKVYFNLAAAHQSLGDQLRSSSQNNPQSLAANREIIQAHYLKAEEYLKTYQKLVPGDLTGYCSLGIVYLREDKIPEAEAMFQQTVSLNSNPDPSQTRWRVLAYIHLAQIAEAARKDLAGARRNLENALNLAPKDLEVMKQIIRICQALQDQKCVADYEAKIKAVLEEIKAQAQAAQAAQAAAGATAGVQNATTATPATGSTAKPAPGPEKPAPGVTPPAPGNTVKPVPATPPASGNTVKPPALTAPTPGSTVPAVKPGVTAGP